MERNRDSHALPLLLSMLRDKKPGSSIMSLVNATTIDLICKLFSREDYVSFAAQVTNISVAKDLLDFILHLLHDPRLMTLNGTMDIKRRGRRFIMKVITKTPVIPESLIVTGIKTAEHDHVGRGGFGHVFMGELQGNAVALKVLYKADNNVAFCREALMWRSLRHKFVLPFLGIYQDEAMEQLFLVSPYMKNGTLAQWRKKVNPSVAEIEQRVLEVAKGLEYIHLEGIVHGDLRGVNVLLDADLHVQIADFGLTRLSEATNTRSGALHLNFAAPELFGFCEDDDSDDDDDVPMRTQRSDVYAFGCLYYEIHYDSIPFVGKTDKQIMKYLSRGAHPPRLPEPPLNDGAWELIRSCWVREASNRPRIEEVTKRMIRASPDPSYEAKIGSEKLDEASNKRRKNEARYNRPIGSRPLTKHNAKNHMEFHVNLNDWICEACGEGLTTGSTPIRHLTVCKKRKGQLGETKDARTLGASGLPYILSSPNAERLYYQQSPRSMHLSQTFAKMIDMCFQDTCLIHITSCRRNQNHQH
ncbi:hypothetical protein AX14_005639 [Amanita brunnescens Koide BX004]|nr:hypothetical protein AX14_005639 [Amanita brunnescens Koide BX004]